MSYIIPSMFGLFLCGSFLCGLFQRPSPFIDQRVADKQILHSDWTEIKLDKPLKPIGDYQEIGLVLAKPYKLDLLGPRGVRVANGSIVLPEVELVTSDGVVAQMRYSGARGGTTITYRLKDESTKRDYVRIRIRADHEVPLEAVFWTGIVKKNMP